MQRPYGIDHYVATAVVSDKASLDMQKLMHNVTVYVQVAKYITHRSTKAFAHSNPLQTLFVFTSTQPHLRAHIKLTVCLRP